MNIIKVKDRNPELIEQLTKVWKDSVKATHLFLSDEEIDGQKLEMLFIAPNERGRGLGKRLLEYGIREYAVNELGVNEQNPQARGFYEHKGFQVYKRTETDEQGMPYPILYMRLS